MHLSRLDPSTYAHVGTRAEPCSRLAAPYVRLLRRNPHLGASHISLLAPEVFVCPGPARPHQQEPGCLQGQRWDQRLLAMHTFWCHKSLSKILASLLDVALCLARNIDPSCGHAHEGQPAPSMGARSCMHAAWRCGAAALRRCIAAVRCIRGNLLKGASTHDLCMSEHAALH